MTIGYRRWCVTPEGRLEPLGRHSADELGTWTDQTATAACYCRYEFTAIADPHPVAANDRWTCGLYAYAAPVPPCTCDDPTDPRHGAVGVVDLHGKAARHEGGWRAEQATVVAVVDFTGQYKPVPGVQVYPTLEAMYAEWPPEVDAPWIDQELWCGHWPMMSGIFDTPGVLYVAPAGTKHGQSGWTQLGYTSGVAVVQTASGSYVSVSGAAALAATAMLRKSLTVSVGRAVGKTAAAEHWQGPDAAQVIEDEMVNAYDDLQAHLFPESAAARTGTWASALVGFKVSNQVAAGTTLDSLVGRKTRPGLLEAASPPAGPFKVPGVEPVEPVQTTSWRDRIKPKRRKGRIW